MQSPPQPRKGDILAVGCGQGAIRQYHLASPAGILAAARQQFKENPDDQEIQRDLLLSLWSMYLDRKHAKDPEAKSVLQEAIDVGAKMNEKSQTAFAGWLKAFAREEKVSGTN